MYRAIFTDLDGTLLDDDKNISTENIESIKKAIDKNVLVCICTGRQYDISKRFKQIAGASKYIICSNGTLIMDSDKNEELFSMGIRPQIVKLVYDYVEENNLVIRLDTKYGRFVNSEEFNVSTEILITETIEEFLVKNIVLQISIVSNKMEHVKKAIDDLDLNQFQDIKEENTFEFKSSVVDYSCVNYINKNASKGNAISGLCKFLKIDLNDVIAIGDDKNDISMFETVGLGIAMGNAEENIKNIAKETTKTNLENGIAEVIKNKIL